MYQHKREHCKDADTAVVPTLGRPESRGLPKEFPPIRPPGIYSLTIAEGRPAFAGVGSVVIVAAVVRAEC